MIRATGLALLLLVVPAAGKDDNRLPASKLKPHCVTTTVTARNGTLAFRSCPEMVNVFRLQDLARKARLAKPCDLKRRVRSPVDGKCYFPERLP
jgi:hypothetical protein